ncbi:MAG: response regulator [Rhodospirillaceae bacterium]
MPDPDGLKTAQVILKSDTLEKTPHIIMVSAYSHDEVMTRVDQLGIDGFLSKPVDKSILLESIVSIFVRKETVAIGSQSPTPAAPRQLRGARVLLAEDNEINRHIALEFLSEAGVLIDIAVNGREAVEKVLADPDRYDAVLMDVQMPEMDGLEATRRIRAELGPEHLPIIAMTAHAMDFERRRCLDAGMVDHIAKPIDPKDLMETLARRLKRRAADTAPDSSGVDEPEPAPAPAVDWPPPPLLPDHLPPFGLAAALARLGGRRDLVRRIVAGFHESFAGAAPEMDRMLAENRLADLERLAHTLKSAAATLEATPLAEAAADLEYALHDGTLAAVPVLVVAVKDKLAPAVRAASTLADAGPPVVAASVREAVPAPFDRDKIRAILDEMQALFAKNSPKSRKLVAAVSESLDGRDFGEALDDMRRSLNRFDFRSAEKALAIIFERLETIK